MQPPKTKCIQTIRSGIAISASVADNMLPGVVDIFDRTCKFVLHERFSLTEIYVELVLGAKYE